MTATRERRLRDILATIADAGNVDREILAGAIQRRWGVSNNTAMDYIKDLRLRGVVVSRFGILTVKDGPPLPIEELFKPSPHEILEKDLE